MLGISLFTNPLKVSFDADEQTVSILESPEKTKKKNLPLLLLKLAVTGIIFYLIFKKIDLEKTFSYLAGTNWFLMVLALCAFLVSKIISAYRLNRFYQIKGLKLSSALNIKLYLLAMYYSLFIPGIGGDGFKVYWLNKRYGFKVKSSIWTALVDRLSGFVALCVLSILFFELSTFELPYKWWLLTLIPLGYLIFYLVFKFFSKGFLPIFGTTNFQSLIVQSLQVVCVWFIIQSLGIDTSVNEYIFIFLVSCLAFVIPVFGVREAAFVFGAKWLGLNPELTAAISVLFYCCLALTSLSGIYYFFLPDELHPGQGRYEKPISISQG